MWQALVVAWNVYKTIRDFRRDLEANATKTLSEANAKKLRLKLEALFANLEQGRVDKLPKYLQWACKLSDVDELFGTFGQHVLKSGKIERKDPALYRIH